MTLSLEELELYQNMLEELRVGEEVHNQQRPMSHEQQLLIAELQNLEADFIALCKRIGTSRDLSLAVTYMEDAAMRAVRHVLGGK